VAGKQQPDRLTADVPPDIERALEAMVVHHLRSEFRARGLLLPADVFERAAAGTMQRGESLFAEFVERWCGVRLQDGMNMSLRFQSAETRSHIGAALTFGAVSADLLAACPEGALARSARLCAIFNLGIGIVDSLCDEDAGVGITLLDLLEGDVLMACAETARARGWLRAALPDAYARNAALGFTADVIEVFFDELHSMWPDGQSADLRWLVGSQLAGALAAEHHSVCWQPDVAGRERSLATSRLTSVLPFQIIETLARGAITTDEWKTGTLLGEAFWRIDDLTDLCSDTRGGALNGVLLRAWGEGAEADGCYDPSSAIGGLLDSTLIATIAAEAADRLATASSTGHSGGASLGAVSEFLYFIQSYAGISPTE
jgi:hypothetical protein